MAGEKILVIEDNAMNMQLTVDLLEAAGYAVIQAETAEKGIELAKTEVPDLILMDISLPGMDGLSATRILKRDPKTKGISIVSLSAHAMEKELEEMLDAGCSGCITKPIDTREFRKTIVNFLESGGGV